MKKVLVTIAALGLVAGAATAASAVEWQISGKYMVEGAYLNSAGTTLDGLGNPHNGVQATETPGTSNPSDAYYLHTFEINPSMKVNDKISMYSVVRLADNTFWGNQTNGDVAGGNTMETTRGNSSGVYIHQLFMDYLSPIGKFRMGRVSAGTFGTSFLDFDQHADRIILYPSFLAGGPWSSQFYLQKTTDSRPAIAGTTSSDSDNNKYVARGFYKTDSVNAGVEYAYGRNAVTGNTTTVLQDASIYAMAKLNNFYLNTEVIYYFGNVNYDAGVANSKDIDSVAGMLNVGGKFDKLDVGAMAFYAEGQGTDPHEISSALNPTGGNTTTPGNSSVGTGDLFEPFYVLTGKHTGILNNNLFDKYTLTASNAGARAAGVYANYAVSDKMTVHGAVGYAAADKKNTFRESDYGWEYDLGMAYKLLDNLTYEAHFGFLDTGDFFNGPSTTDTTKNIYVLSHSLTMTF